MGQFLFVERYTGQPLLDCFTELLLAGRPDFAWSERDATLRYAEIEPLAMQTIERDRTLHVERIVTAPYEGTGA
jgi:hypothetical protein